MLLWKGLTTKRYDDRLRTLFKNVKGAFIFYLWLHLDHTKQVLKLALIILIKMGYPNLIFNSNWLFLYQPAYLISETGTNSSNKLIPLFMIKRNIIKKIRTLTKKNVFNVDDVERQKRPFIAGGNAE